MIRIYTSAANTVVVGYNDLKTDKKMVSTLLGYKYRVVL